MTTIEFQIKGIWHGDIMVFKSLLPHPLTFIYSQFNINIGDIMVAGRGHKKASDEEILKAYQETNNIWKAAEKLEMCGQNVWKRLKRLGVEFDQRIFSLKEKDCLQKHYKKYALEGRLDDLAKLMGRTKQFLARQAGKLGLTDQHRVKPWLLKGRLREPTKPERIFQQICKRNNIDFYYVGDGQLWIGKKKKLNPDFIEANGKKICVEIMGAYWHSRLLNRNLREDALLPFREKHYKKYKWQSIFIWDTDLLREDAEQFVLNMLKKAQV
ncbi:unnamed protein product [marine sediment metagenome]|uniref:DUF559 domain-containing protein n=1 Tax=marine sediment metagenome TaxID=412755 RepID=X1EXU0_9ZZZZ